MRGIFQVSGINERLRGVVQDSARGGSVNKRGAGQSHAGGAGPKQRAPGSGPVQQSAANGDRGRLKSAANPCPSRQAAETQSNRRGGVPQPCRSARVVHSWPRPEKIGDFLVADFRRFLLSGRWLSEELLDFGIRHRR